jgi:predicted amidohydrolase
MKVAGVQMDIVFADRQANLARIGERLRETAQAGARLTVFPECALPGYCFDSVDEARLHAETVPGPSTLKLAKICRELTTYAVIGLLEADGERLFNAAVLVGPDGVVASYRKVHLPYLGVDRFTTPGDRPFAVHAMGDGAGEARVGMSICYDAAFPEAARVLALEGADVIALPTNWPPGAECTAEFVINARAMENNVYYMAVNRVGNERGFHFIGHSKICDPRGHILAQARHENETILYADIDLAFARQKHIVRVPGKHEIDRFADRRPEFYGRILER